MSQWTIRSQFHDLNEIERGVRKGRNPYEGYVRGAGLQFGNVKDLCTSDPDFVQAYQLAQGRTLVDLYKLNNFYMLIRFFLPKLNPGAIARSIAPAPCRRGHPALRREWQRIGSIAGSPLSPSKLPLAFTLGPNPWPSRRRTSHR